MDKLISFNGSVLPEGNLLKWSKFEQKKGKLSILRSTDGILFKPVELGKEILGELKNYGDAEIWSYQYLDTTVKKKGVYYYQLAFDQEKEETQYSEIVELTRSSGFSWLVLGARLLVVGGLLFGTYSLSQNFIAQKKAPPKFTPPAAERFVKVQPVNYKSYGTSVSALGRVVSAQPLDIVSEVSGRIQQGDVTLNKAVDIQEGEVLFNVDNREAVLSLKSQRSTFLNQLAVILPDLKLDYADQFDKWNRYFQKVTVDGYLPTLPKMGNQREKTFIASRNIPTTYYNIKSAEERLSKYVIRAPYDGSITDVFQDVGSLASPAARVMRVIRTDELELELPIRKEDLQWLKKGTRVQLSSEDDKIATSGTVQRISRVLDPTTQSVNAYVSISPKRGLDLFEGMYMKANLKGTNVGNAMEVSRQAIFEGNKVFVVENGVLTQKEIQIQKLNTSTVLFKGLDKGTQLVVEPLTDLGVKDSVSVLRVGE